MDASRCTPYMYGTCTFPTRMKSQYSAQAQYEARRALGKVKKIKTGLVNSLIRFLGNGWLVLLHIRLRENGRYKQLAQKPRERELPFLFPSFTPQARPSSLLPKRAQA